MRARYFVALLICNGLGWFAAAPTRAQTVQLPTIHYFAWEGSVLVPDQGDAGWNGIARNRGGRDQLGLTPLRPRSAVGAERSAGGLAVSARIHDFQALEDASAGKSLVLRRADSSSPVRSQVRAHQLEAAVDRALPSVTEIRRRQVQESAARGRESLDLYRRGQRAQACGKPGVALIYYRMAARHATGRLAEEISAAMQAADRESPE